MTYDLLRDFKYKPTLFRAAELYIHLYKYRGEDILLDQLVAQELERAGRGDNLYKVGDVFTVYRKYYSNAGRLSVVKYIGAEEVGGPGYRDSYPKYHSYMEKYNIAQSEAETKARSSNIPLAPEHWWRSQTLIYPAITSECIGVVREILKRTNG